MSIEQPTADYPLPEGHYFSVRNASPLSHSQGGPVSAIRRLLGLRSRAWFDSDLEDAVKAWQESVELPVTGVVTEIDWVLLFQPE